MSDRITVSVISDLVTDQRVQRECRTLERMGFQVKLIGRKSPRKLQASTFSYRVFRVWVPFKRGPWMYLSFNVSLFFYLLFSRADLLWANDLDTLLPNYLVARLKGIKLIYDSHEYFTASVYKKSSRVLWEKLERALFPKLRNVITVNESIRTVYQEKYRVPVTVLRNVPEKLSSRKEDDPESFPEGKKVLIIQGMGINPHRGAEEAVAAMQYLPDVYQLYFIGGGTILPRLKDMVEKLQLHSRVIFIDPLPYPKMMGYTRRCFLGLIFEKIQVSQEHLYSLPNKFFDYIHAGIPVLSSRAVEIERLIQSYGIGDFIDSFDPRVIAEKIQEIGANTSQYEIWKSHTLKAALELNWENEQKTLVDFMQQLS